LVDRAVDDAVHALAEQHAARKHAGAASGTTDEPCDSDGAPPPTTGIIARATPAVDGAAAWIEWGPTFAPEAAAAPGAPGAPGATGATGAAGAAGDAGAPATAIDHYNRVKRMKVAANEALGRIHPPGDGVDGRDVCGRNISARRGRKLALSPDGSVQVEADGTIRSLKDGVLSLARLRIAVVDALEVAGAVDFSTGNIDFVGSVKVADGVRDNFTLKATGDVVVRGLVEAADVIVGGDFRGERGIAARGSGHLLVDGSVETAYLNSVRGRVRGSIAADREIVGCELVVGGDLRIARGAIVGGHIVVGGCVRVDAIGTEGGAKTALRVGGLPFELARAARIAQLVKELARQVAPLEERQFEITGRGSKATAAEKESLTELAFEIAEVRRRIMLLEEERKNLLIDNGMRRTVSIEVAKAIHAGTTIHVGTREARFTSSLKGPVRLDWDESRNLQFRVAGGRVQDLSDVATVREVAA
ncbi:MAG: FapA family protein, partial [bacterium]